MFSRRRAAAVVAIALVGFTWCERRYGLYDWQTGRRICGDAPAQIAVWSYTRHTRRPDEAANLQAWIARDRGRVTRQYAARCETPLHIAAKFGREDLAELLISAGADVEAVDGSEYRPLHSAAFNGRPTVVALLIKRGATVTAPARDGRTPLHEAVEGLLPTKDAAAQLEVAKLLLAAGADVNARTRGGGFTPIALATMGERPGGNAMAELLLSSGASVHRTGQASPLVSVAHMGNLEALRLLIERGANPNEADRDTTALGSAAAGGQVNVVRFLLDKGAAVDRRVAGSRLEWEGLPLAMALDVARTRDHQTKASRHEAARVLLDHGAEPDPRNRTGETLVHCMASNGDGAAIDLLLSHGAQASARDTRGFTPLHAAARHGWTDAAKRLLAAGASPHARAADGTTPFDLAAGDPVMRSLLSRDAKP